MQHAASGRSCKFSSQRGGPFGAAGGGGGVGGGFGLGFRVWGLGFGV